MENLETFLKNEEKEYKQRVIEKTKTGLKMEYIAFNLAIKENVQWLEEAYQKYMNNEITKSAFEYRINDNKQHINHWQNMIEIVVDELLKRSETDDINI